MSNAWSLRLAPALIVVAAACGGGVAGEVPGDGTAMGAAQRTVNVEVLEAAPEHFDDRLTITGTIEARRAVTLTAEESGVVREVYVDRGRHVRVGQAIARIDDRVLRAHYDQARSEAELARQTFERQRRLWEDEQIGSEMNYLRARHAAEAAAASERVLAARLDRTIIRAPIGGVLDDRFVEVGALAGPGTPVARIIDADTVRVTAGVPERYAGEIRTGAPATVTVDNLPDGEFDGLIRFVGAAVSEQNRTFPLEVRVPNGAGRLKPGMAARVRVTRATLPDAILVPREAVLRTEDGYRVFVVRQEDGRFVAHAAAVVTGPGAGNRVVITAGLQPGDLVVVVGQQQVAAGDIVRLAEGRRP
jgi:membrane fusion protein, multidrug efflux system